jgi:hypothetical protein
MTDSSSEASPPAQSRPKLDTTISHPARVWNYWLGGKDNFAVDREVGDQIAAVYPYIAELARADRAFLARAVDYLAREVGIRQFLDIGTGLPTANNTHELAQAIAPESRIVYADNDPLVLTHARALLTSSPEGVTDYVAADLRDPHKILEAAAKTLDFTQPIAITMLSVVIFITDDDDAYRIVKDLVDALPSGSYLVLTQTTNVVHGHVTDEGVRLWNESGAYPMVVRNIEQITRFFDGLEILTPGVVPLNQWRPNPTEGPGNDLDEYCAVARKP